MTEPLSVLTFSTLYPNQQQPRHGIFVQQRLRHLCADYPVRARVVAPVPWFPFRNPAFGQYGVYASVPPREVIEDVPVWHPRFLVVPKISWRISPWLMARATRGLVERLHASARIDVIDAHFLYPDGVAAVMVGRALNIPVVISARGSDVTLMSNFAVSRRAIQWAAAKAQGVITVASALRDRLVEIGVDGGRIEVLRNGVDLERFQPGDRTSIRQRLGLRGRVLLSVGNLIELKGHHLIIEALGALPDTDLLIIGEGPMRAALERLATEQRVAERVHFLGLIPQRELSSYYSAADALVLASSREGWANVLLEAMACGTPVVATRVWGTPEVVAEAAAGVLVDERSVDGLLDGIRRLWAHPPSRDATRAYAERFSWAATSRGQYDLFSRLREQHRRA